MMLVLQGWEYVRNVMIRRLTVSSYPVGMPELVKDVLPESIALVNLVLPVERVSPKSISFTCNISNILVTCTYIPGTDIHGFLVFLICHAFFYLLFNDVSCVIMNI